MLSLLPTPRRGRTRSDVLIVLLKDAARASSLTDVCAFGMEYKGRSNGEQLPPPMIPTCRTFS